MSQSRHCSVGPTKSSGGSIGGHSSEVHVELDSWLPKQWRHQTS